MGKILFAAVLLAASAAFADDVRRCPRPEKGEPVVFENEFSWTQTRADLATNFNWLYGSGKRLMGRAFYNETSRTYEFPSPYGAVTVDPLFIASVTRHVELALERGYAEFIFFPDMGHSHFQVPLKDWEILDRENDRAKLYEKFLGLRSLKILYHTAEQLQIHEGQGADRRLPQDPQLLWRYFSRNILGDNQTGENLAVLFNGPEGYNTVRDVPGHFLYSAGFYISASKDGCFPFRQNGKTLYFDLSLTEMPVDPSRPGR